MDWLLTDKRFNEPPPSLDIMEFLNSPEFHISHARLLYRYLNPNDKIPEDEQLLAWYDSEYPVRQRKD